MGCSYLCPSHLCPSHTGQTDTKRTSNRQKSSNSGRDRFTVGIDSVLSVWCRFMLGQTNLSGRDLSNMFERSLPDKLSVVCRLYFAVVLVLSGSVRGRVSLNSATDGRWFFGHPNQYGHHFAYDILKYNFYENLCNLIETSLKFVRKDPMNNMPAFVQLTLMSFKYNFLIYCHKKISTEMSLQGNLPFLWMPTHLPYWYQEYVYTNTIYLYWSTFYVEGSLYIHLAMSTCFIFSVFFSIDEIKIFIIIIIYELIAAGWRMHTSARQESILAFVMIMAPCHFLNKWRFDVNLAYFDIRICVGLWSVCCRFVIGLSSGLSVCCRLRFLHCADDRFSVGAMSVIYRSQIGRFHTESYPKWPRHEPDWFYGVFSNIVGGRQLADSLKFLRFLSVSCRFGRCDWGIIHAWDICFWCQSSFFLWNFGCLHTYKNEFLGFVWKTVTFYNNLKLTSWYLRSLGQ